jgi:hypothetical protein
MHEFIAKELDNCFLFSICCEVNPVLISFFGLNFVKFKEIPSKILDSMINYQLFVNENLFF